MTTYRKKPETIDAIQYINDNYDDVKFFCKRDIIKLERIEQNINKDTEPCLLIIEDNFNYFNSYPVFNGDWIIRDGPDCSNYVPARKFQLMSNDEFTNTYEKDYYRTNERD
jgi:hypothetical protein